MEFDIITIFPGIFDSYFGESIIRRAREKKIIDIRIHNLRDYTADKHKTVDDTPYGGGAGMVMKVEPIEKAIRSIMSVRYAGQKILKNSNTCIILFSAKGKKYSQTVAKRLTKYEHIIMICGRYEGVDERVAEYIADEEISIGDFILTGGEIPAMVLADSIARLIPGVLGNAQSASDESHSKKGYLEYPQYTKPESYGDWKVPEVLLSGNHDLIRKWRKDHSMKYRNS